MRGGIWFFLAGVWLVLGVWQAAMGNAWLALLDGLVAAGNVALGVMSTERAS